MKSYGIATVITVHPEGGTDDISLRTTNDNLLVVIETKSGGGGGGSPK